VLDRIEMRQLARTVICSFQVKIPYLYQWGKDGITCNIIKHVRIVPSISVELVVEKVCKVQRAFLVVVGHF